MTAHNVEMAPESVTLSALNVSVRNAIPCPFCHQAKWEGEKCKSCDTIPEKQMTRAERGEIARATRRKLVKRIREPNYHRILTDITNQYGYYDQGELHIHKKGLKKLGL